MQRLLQLLVLLLLCGWTHGFLPAYTGNFATRASIPDAISASNKQVMSRVTHYARATVSTIQIAVPNFYASNGAETGSGATASITASVEYPQNVCTQITFSGVATGSISNNSFLLSDSVSLFIPSGATFWLRLFFQSTGGILYRVNHSDLTIGDATNAAASGLSDQTVNCTSVTNNFSQGAFFPAAILSSIRVPSVCVVGDSIVSGVGDGQNSSDDAFGDKGIITPSIGPSFGYINFSVGGDTAANFVANHGNRAQLFPYCSHGIVEYGHNDFDGGQTVAGLETNLTAIYNLFPAATGLFQTTLTPLTTSSNSWATLAGQTVSSWETNRVTFNTALRNATFGPNKGMFDITNPLESGVNSGLWKAGAGFPQCAPWTNDGIHPYSCSYQFTASSGVIDTTRITYPR